ncbi:unnamed protein product [Caenorhabditis nigoni]
MRLFRRQLSKCLQQDGCPESCSTNKSFRHQNQKFRDYETGTIKKTSPTEKTQEEACRFLDPGNHVVDATRSGNHVVDAAMSGNHGIDATMSGNQAKFVNHSCDPNLIAAEKWKLHGMPKT